MDYADGRLHFLNDWRANTEGIDPACFNHFVLTFNDTTLELNVYGDGRVTVLEDGEPRTDVAAGAYGFGASPSWSDPHTIYEFSLKMDPAVVNVCCTDPISMNNCNVLTAEPVVMSLDATGPVVRVGRSVPPDVIRVPIGSSCAMGAGLCEESARCEKSDTDAICVRIVAPDAGVPDSGPPA